MIASRLVRLHFYVIGTNVIFPVQHIIVSIASNEIWRIVFHSLQMTVIPELAVVDLTGKVRLKAQILSSVIQADGVAVLHPVNWLVVI